MASKVCHFVLTPLDLSPTSAPRPLLAPKAQKIRFCSHMSINRIDCCQLISVCELTCLLENRKNVPKTHELKKAFADDLGSISCIKLEINASFSLRL